MKRAILVSLALLGLVLLMHSPARAPAPEETPASPASPANPAGPQAMLWPDVPAPPGAEPAGAPIPAGFDQRTLTVAAGDPEVLTAWYEQELTARVGAPAPRRRRSAHAAL